MWKWSWPDITCYFDILLEGLKKTSVTAVDVPRNNKKFWEELIA
jgi:hypothetical protein